jgi:hypothetical protein
VAERCPAAPGTFHHWLLVLSPDDATIDRSLGAAVYFCDSHSPWHRVSNETSTACSASTSDLYWSSGVVVGWQSVACRRTPAGSAQRALSKSDRQSRLTVRWDKREGHGPVMVIGVDPHKRTHTATAVDPQTNRAVASVRIQASLTEYRRMLMWAAAEADGSRRTIDIAPFLWYLLSAHLAATDGRACGCERNAGAPACEGTRHVSWAWHSNCQAKASGTPPGACTSAGQATERGSSRPRPQAGIRRAVLTLPGRCR